MPNNTLDDGITVVTKVEEKVDKVPRVRIRLPEPEETGSGMKADPYEHVTINGANPTYIKKGEWVEVPVPIFEQLRNRYPNI